MAMARRPHALVWPTPYQGHINALMQLSQHLAACRGFRITFLNTEHNHARIMAARSKQPQQQQQQQPSSPPYPEITMVALPDGLSSDDRPRSVDLKTLGESIDAHMLPLVEQLICSINQTEDPITCIIADAFCHQVHGIAERAGVSCVIGFFPCSAAQLCCMYHVPLLISTGQLKPDGTPNKDQERITGIPGLRDIPVKSVIWQVGTQANNDFLFDMVKSTVRQAKRFKAILLNSFNELEKEALDALNQEDLRVLLVGPLVLLDSHEALYNVSRSDFWVQEEACLTWLDDKPKASVLYIAFGSIAIFDTDELHALALGLEASGHNFLWVLRPDLMNGAPASLPVGFQERTKDRGFLTSWAPQARVLSHASVGGFLTHCGWNSIMEAMAMGVPMLAWPYFGDQRGNCTYIVEVWKVALPMLGRDGKVVGKEEVEKIIRSLLSGIEGEQMSRRIASLKEKAIQAIEKGTGTSYTNLTEIVNELHQPPT